MNPHPSMEICHHILKANNDYLYQKKLHEPLAEVKPAGMKAEDWTLLDRQALGVVRLSLVNNLVNTKMEEGASVAHHVNEFNSILSRLVSVDIKFNDEVHALLLLYSLSDSWSSNVTTVSGSTGTTKLTAKDKGKGRKQDRGQKENRGISKLKKRASRDKEVNMKVRDSDDALVCCVENTIEDRIMDSGASFHATYCKEELKRFKLRSGKVRLADDKTLDIACVGDVVLKTSFGTSWTMKDATYIPGLRRMLIFVCQLDEEGHHVGFEDQHWKVTKGSLVVARVNKCGSIYMVEVPSDRVNASIDGRGNATLWPQRLGHMSDKGIVTISIFQVNELKTIYFETLHVYFYM
ncbi:hypothetical protein Tco_0009431 [Tanacetum coccineum]